MANKKHIYDDWTVEITEDRSTNTFDLLVYRTSDTTHASAYASVGWASYDLAYQKARTWMNYMDAKAKFQSA